MRTPKSEQAYAANPIFTFLPSLDSNAINISRLNFSHLPRTRSAGNYYSTIAE